MAVAGRAPCRSPAMSPTPAARRGSRRGRLRRPSGPASTWCATTLASCSSGRSPLRAQADWDWLLQGEPVGVVNVARTFVPRMRAQGEGLRHMVNTALPSRASSPCRVWASTRPRSTRSSGSARRCATSSKARRDRRLRALPWPDTQPHRRDRPDHHRAGTGGIRGSWQSSTSWRPARPSRWSRALLWGRARKQKLYIFSHKLGRIAAQRRFDEILADLDAAP